MANVLKSLESKTINEWKNDLGIQVRRLWCFRQGGDEFCLVVWCFRQGGDEFCLVVNGKQFKEGTQQKVYKILKKEISKIKIENMENKKYLTISAGVCLGYGIRDYEYIMRKADTAAEIVKENGRDNIRIWSQTKGKMYS
eukprot:491229_1